MDRVDRLPDGGYELIDYKTGRPKSGAQLEDDVQLSLYAVGAREAWELEAGDAGLPTTCSTTRRSRCRATRPTATGSPTRCSEVADGILGQGFEPTPSYAACSICDFRIVCPAAA